MKIVCESCGAKYSIADERVSGKMFKIRCKKCSEVIVVRGDQPREAAAPAAPPAQEAIWHVVVEGEQAGPYTAAQLGEMLTNATVDWDAYVWTEGFDNWAPMRDVPDLVAQITGQAPAQPAQAAPAYAPSTQTLTGQPSMGADPFADDGGAADPFVGGGMAASQDLFAGGAAQPARMGRGGDDAGVMSSSPSPRVAPQAAMTGARNENSVLFSLKNLQALATGSSTPSAPPQAAAASNGSAGFAGGEGSGLIDIRALASTTGVGEPGQVAGHKDELLSMGSQGGAFGTLGSPMLSPVRDDSSGNKKTLVWAVVAGFALVSLAFVAAVYILRTTPTQQPLPSVAVAPPPAVAQGAIVPAAAQPAAAAAANPAAAVPPTEGELAARQAQEDKAKEAERARSSGASSSGEHHHHHGDTAAKSPGGSESASAAEPEPKKPPPKSGPRTIDDLLEGALNSSSSAKPSKQESAPKADLPESPSREQAMAAMNSVKPAVVACAKGQGGVATVQVSVAGASGRVTNAEVNGITGPAGSCIAQAVRKAQFPKFSNNVFKLTFPYKL